MTIKKRNNRYKGATQHLLYYHPLRNRFVVSNEKRQVLLLETKLDDGRIKRIWAAYQKIPSTCIFIGKYD